MDLRLHAIALQAAGMAAKWHPIDDNFDLERVDVSVEVEGFDERLTIQITQPPVAEGSLGKLEMLQLYAPIPVILSDLELEWMVHALSHANAMAPLVGFGVHEAESFLYFRTLLLIPPAEGPHEEAGYTITVEGVWLTFYALDLHAANLIEGAQEAVAEAIAEVDAEDNNHA